MPYNLPKRLRISRCHKRWSIRELSQASLVPEKLIDDFEEDRAEPSAPIIFLLCKALGCTADYLLGFSREDRAK